MYPTLVLCDPAFAWFCSRMFQLFYMFQPCLDLYIPALLWCGSALVLICMLQPGIVLYAPALV